MVDYINMTLQVRYAKKKQEIQDTLKPTLFAFPNHKTDLQILILPTNAQLYYCVFHF